MTETVVTKIENRSVSQSLHASNPMQGTSDRPNISVAPKDNESCSLNIHKSHSFNHTLDYFNKITLESSSCIPKNNLLARPNQLLNCNFRPTGSLSYKSYCSCLVLTQDTVTVCGNEFEKFSTSLPNLEFSLENESFKTSFQTSDTPNSNDSSLTDNESYVLPVIDLDHIITINVEAAT